MVRAANITNPLYETLAKPHLKQYQSRRTAESVWFCYPDRRYIQIKPNGVELRNQFARPFVTIRYGMEAMMKKVMPFYIRLTAFAVCLLGLHTVAWGADDATQTAKAEVENDWISTTEEQKDLTVFYKGREVAIYHTGPALDKPYFHPLRTPDGRVVTYDSPADHLHHRGLSIGWPDINGEDFWAEVNAAPGHRGHQDTRGQKVETNDAGEMVINEVNTWFTETGDVLLNESRKWRFYPPQGNLQIVDVDILFSPVAEKVVFGSNPDKPVEYHGLTLRIGPFEDVRFYNSEGAEGDTECHGKPAKWVAVSGTQAGRPVTVAFLDSANNDSHPAQFFVLGRGMQFISTSPNFSSPKVLYDGRTWRLTYRIVAAGAPPEGQEWDMERLWRDYNKLP